MERPGCACRRTCDDTRGAGTRQGPDRKHPDRLGVPVSNTFRYFTPDGTTRTGVAFAYRTAPLFDPAGPPFPPAAQTDLTPEMINEQGKVSPAPWVPWTRAGCDVGQI